MKIQIDPYTLERAEERGTDDAEIRDVIETGFSIAARGRGTGRPRSTTMASPAVAANINRSESK